MNYTRDQLVAWLLDSRLHTVITFTKIDGTERKMKCRLYDVPVYEKKTDRVREVKADLLPVWDEEKTAWRTITVSAVKNVEFQPSAYFSEENL